MNYFEHHLDCLESHGFGKWRPAFEELLQHLWFQSKDGNLPRFLNVLQQIPAVPDVTCQLNQDWVAITSEQMTPSLSETIGQQLKKLMPWRKGPFHVFDHSIDAEWRCDLKWNRVMPFLSDLRHRKVLDVGSGNGYYGFRMLAAGAATVTGIDPSYLSVCQFLALNCFVQTHRLNVLPMTLEQLPANMEFWDTVFSMGVLYHRRSPFDHLTDLKATLKPGGELVLETLVVEGDEKTVLVPESRYAMMNNIYFLPSSKALESWLRKAGFVNVRTVEESYTSTQEQKHSDWKPGTSLPDYLHPNTKHITVEGLPAPRRAILIANKPLENTKLPRYHIKPASVPSE
ncbi:tRNA 5-methoxyuridine(34)/uridine 5-oxyacetic acid(34) synthase CmoB [Gynuella sunshinyii]|uniref:tRNA U34 carboxymethyltransferase n=1 Tax=Gynuella sunshinyii YC6258 TaxID=1445510 RepID=A0A0C5VVQ3_9GAMM|nr:tRNA 5-methoxyuridine(34)/uridine 5-oxyacetic acid(34) synthase CmoB [Gynuella sunshinyii]AJQ97388.1 2-polyprenyl-3-methyl-5-hydroxy-6-metoxy-1,4-benzoquinol methylase [Gynuella sunshinyii YC6258]